jgi:hypothetical protein
MAKVINAEKFHHGQGKAFGNSGSTLKASYSKVSERGTKRIAKSPQNKFLKSDGLLDLPGIT